MLDLSAFTNSQNAADEKPVAPPRGPPVKRPHNVEYAMFPKAFCNLRLEHFQLTLYEMVHIECSLLIPLSLKFEINVEFNISENKAKCKQSVVASCQLKHADKKQPLVERGLL